MKRYAILAILCLLFAGCKKVMDGPCDYTLCAQPYTPDESVISWSEYNLPQDFNLYFVGYPETIGQHSGDTIKIMGWINAASGLSYITKPVSWSYGKFPIDVYSSDTIDAGWINNPHITDEEEERKKADYVVVMLLGEELERVKNEYEKYENRKVYILGLVNFDEQGCAMPGCLHRFPYVDVINFDTIP